MLHLPRKIIIALVSVIMSFMLLISIPMINLWIKGDLGKKKYTKAAITVSQTKIEPEKQKPQKQRSQPKRSQPTQRTIKSGPRFAMDLGVAGGSTGAGFSTDLLKSSGGGNLGGKNGDVDERPSLRSSPPFQAPAQIRDTETDASLLLSFCVDERGKAYDVRVVEESPSGKGLAQAGKEAIARTQFTPAQKDGKPVPFCGMEQPFEIKFRD